MNLFIPYFIGGDFLKKIPKSGVTLFQIIGK